MQKMLNLSKSRLILKNKTKFCMKSKLNIQMYSLA